MAGLSVPSVPTMFTEKATPTLEVSIGEQKLANIEMAMLIIK